MITTVKCLRWGIASAGRISSDFVSAVNTLPEPHHQVVAVAARTLASAETFAKEHKIPRFYEGYMHLAEDKEIDVVYVGCVNSQHYEVTKMMLEHGKHVLCEKPMTMNEKQTQALVQISHDKKLFLLEGIWSRFFPAYNKLQELIEEKAIGELVMLNASFGFDLQHVERLRSRKLGGGTILDLGIYLLQLQQIVYKHRYPIKEVNVGKLNLQRTDDFFSSFWVYEDHKVAFLSASALTEYPNEAVIIGTKGTIRIPEFWCPTKIFLNDKVFEFSLPKTPATFNFHNSVGLAYEAEHVRECIERGLVQSYRMSHSDSIRLASQMDSIRRDVGVVFEEDSFVVPGSPPLPPL